MKLTTHNIEKYLQLNSDDVLTVKMNKERIRTLITIKNKPKRIKKDNLTPANIGEIMLAQIPSVSSVSAAAIMHKFSNIFLNIFPFYSFKPIFVWKKLTNRHK